MPNIEINTNQILCFFVNKLNEITLMYPCQQSKPLSERKVGKL